MEYAIKVEKLTKVYPTAGKVAIKPALQSLDLSIAKGAIFGLLGSNGAGKSTLINILAGTVIKTSGLVSINGYDLDKTPKLASQQIGIVPQEIVIDNFFSISQTLEFTAGYYGIRPQFRKTEEILKALGLWDKRDALPRELSGGMKRRFLVAKALAHSPEILVLDEPTAGVDIELREQLWEYVQKLNSNGTTIIITTHYLAEAQKLCDQIAFIKNGKIIKQDTKENLLRELGSKHVDVEFYQPFPSYLLKRGKYQILAENKIRFQFNSNDDNFNKLLAEIQSLHGDIKNIEIMQPDLENVFRNLIK